MRSRRQASKSAGISRRDFSDEGLPEFEGQIEDRRDEPIPSGRFEEMVEQWKFALQSMEGDTADTWKWIVEHIEHSINEIGEQLKKLSDSIQGLGGGGDRAARESQPGIGGNLASQFQQALNLITPIIDQIKAKIAEITRDSAALRRLARARQLAVASGRSLLPSCN